MLNIAFLQINSFGFDQQANMEKGIDYCRQAKAIGADIALFPEMWNIGYTIFDNNVFHPYYDPNDINEKKKAENWANHAISQQDKFITCYRKLAKELNMAIAITYLEKNKSGPRNTISLIDRHGEIVLSYSKIHTCDFSLEHFIAPGDVFYVCDLDTEKGKVKVGCMICFDREYPESARILMLKGAEIILTPNACELEQNRIAQIRTRAFENMVGIAVANYPKPEYNGHSIAFDGIAFEKDCSRDHLILEAPEKEGIFMAEFDLDQMREYRQRESWGNAYRQPSKYQLLIDESVKDPFIRNDAKR